MIKTMCQVKNLNKFFKLQTLRLFRMYLVIFEEGILIGRGGYNQVQVVISRFSLDS